MPEQTRLQAPAKINLTLEVLDRRPDGFHGLRSVMVPLALADEIVLEPDQTFSFRCDDPRLGPNNLAERAFRALASAAPAHIDLHKHIPTQAGLGGGSSDAATVLLAAMEGAFGPLPGVEWLEIARALGSDVPFFLVQTGALVEGTGERVTAVGALPLWHVLIVKPPIGVSSADAYAALDLAPRPSRPRKDSVSLRLLDALQRGAFDEVYALQMNDFEPVVAAAHPEIASALVALREAGCGRPMLAGSGACVFALVRTADECAAMQQALDLAPGYEAYATSFAQPGTWRGTVPA